MTLITGDDLLVGSRFFSAGKATPRGSSVDLSIGTIFNHRGEKVDGPFELKAGHMVQVVSAEVFDLPPTITGHVTYKTSLTKKGIWALTVGIVDPGWKGPVTTTLLNFSRVNHPIALGDTFLRVSFYEHDEVSATCLPKSEPTSDYIRDVQKTAISQFPETFLNVDDIAKKAGDAVLKRIREEAVVWVASIAFLFILLQLIANVLHSETARDTSETLNRNHLAAFESRLIKLEAARVQTSDKSPAP